MTSWWEMIRNFHESRIFLWFVNRSQITARVRVEGGVRQGRGSKFSDSLAFGIGLCS